MLDDLIIPYSDIFFTPMSFLLDIVLILLGGNSVLVSREKKA